MATLAVIGGSGLYALSGLAGADEIAVETPYGPPSDRVMRGMLGSTTMLFLPRHGRGHRIAPGDINYRANICALKKLGATHVVSVSAVGSMKESILPGQLVIVDQFIDLTKRRASTFFDEGIAAHVSMADPVCPLLAAATASAAERAGAVVHRGGTYVCIEGPQFSTRAESHVYRSWGVSVIGMTNMPEAKLAREAELPYATIAIATDYDCWHESEDVRVDAILAVLQRSLDSTKRLLVELAPALPDPAKSPARGALASAVLTERTQITPAKRAELAWLLS
ncbi:MAG TPA: S-methyl-5'-thioadenosine phosphorylase [Polyangiaceae bacterium]|nr:S-methyl-5'-thioadenosine phosphorylase [Polyangiaceae bacterium]